MYCQCLMDCLKYETTAQSVNGVKSGADSGGKCCIFRNDKLNGIKRFKKLDHWQKLTQSGKRTCQNDFFDRGVFAGENRKGQNGLQHHVDNAESKITIGCAVLYVCKVCGGDFRTEFFNVILGNIADRKINV